MIVSDTDVLFTYHFIFFSEFSSYFFAVVYYSWHFLNFYHKYIQFDIFIDREKKITNASAGLNLKFKDNANLYHMMVWICYTFVSVYSLFAYSFFVYNRTSIPLKSKSKITIYTTCWMNFDTSGFFCAGCHK